MRIRRGPRLDTTFLGAASLLAIAMGGGSGGPVPDVPRPAVVTGSTEPPAVAGSWRSADGAVDLMLRTDSTYDLAVQGRERKAHGTYAVDGSDLRLRDDSGLRTPGRVVTDGYIEMAGHELFPV